KSRVLSIINDAIEVRNLDQTAAAAILGIDQADASRLINGKLRRFSLDRLMAFVDRLNIPIELSQSRDSDGHLVVKVQHLALC
ncbi:MAG: helix-turn-helix domain-containing protein, partial [Vulcanimicrobiaceae bacterium]